ncbi:MAG: triphosphoribosyl-dephospho-CoA synthase [Methanothrix sp.]|nr:triphosphoribosyl-dephospho-CoA synthase [Methanothrix sp.]
MSIDRSPDRVAQCAVLAMLFELSSSPKPGNVDRCHDFSDIGFHHFLASAVSAYPVFRKAAQSRRSVGSLILEGVEAWQTWNLNSNTHFGSLVLMIPIAIAARRPGELQAELRDVLEKTTAIDAIDFYSAFEKAKARVAEVDNFSLNDKNWQKAVQGSGKTLRELMRLSSKHDIVAREWSTNYERSFLLADRMAKKIGRWGLNDGVVRTFLEALAEVPDSLICAKFGVELARQVSGLAGEALRDDTLGKAHELDRNLLAQDINPGSTADLIAASLFISLLRGLRF